MRLALLALACGISVGNLYFNQPLLAAIAHDFGVDERTAGQVTTLTQVGYALGILGVVPLADIHDRRRLILTLLGAVTGALALAASAPTFAWLAGASLLIGLTTVTPQVIIPMAAGLVEPFQRGRVVGTLQGGLVAGILLARTAGGAIGEVVGWRGTYIVAASAMLALAGALVRTLPHHSPEKHLSYRQIIGSLIPLVRKEPVLRYAALAGALAFAAERLLWTILPFYLEGPPYYYGPAAAGLFGFVGVAGASAAALLGRLADKRGPLFTGGLALASSTASFVLLGLGSQHLPGLIIGVLLLDVGLQGTQTSNQARIMALPSGAHNRLNTLYMAAAFTGGAFGSLVGSWAWAVGGWAGVCLVGGALTTTALLAHVWQRWRLRETAAPGPEGAALR